MPKRILSVFLAIVIAFTSFSVLTGCGKKEEVVEAVEEEAGDDSSGEEAEEELSTEPIEVTNDISLYKQSIMKDIVRPVTKCDLARNRSYTVTDERMETLIDTLDFLLNSKELKDIAGFGIADVTPMVTGFLYNNDLINLAVQYLYPLVETEFAKVWAGLPQDIAMEGDDAVGTGIAIVPKAEVHADLTFISLEDAMENIKFYLMPSTLAKHLPAEYADVAAKLNQATTVSRWDPEAEEMHTAWKDEVLLNSEGKLDLDWGVHDRESFLNAFAAAMCGVEPLLMALLANKAVDNRGHIGTGIGTAELLKGKLKLRMEITTIELNLTASANSGYNNTLAPIFEALGVTAPDADKYDSLRDVVEHGLLEPLDAILEELGKAPVSFLLSALPNLAYAIEAGLVVPLLSMLKTDIAYTADATYEVTVIGKKVAGGVSENAASSGDEPIHIDVGTMINLEDMGLDISSLNGLLGMATDALGFALPEINGDKLATLGSLEWHDTVRNDWTYSGAEEGKAAYIKANRADVLLFLLKYVLEGLKDKTVLNGLLAKIGSDLPDIVNEIIKNVLACPDYTIAALVELFVPQEYKEPKCIWWQHGGQSSNPAKWTYNNYWTSAKADYLVGNLPTLIDNILSIANLEIAGVKASSLSGLLDGLINSFIKAETLNNLAKTVNDAVGGISLPEALTNILKDQLGVDLTYWSTYKAEFKDGDKAGFRDALVSFAKPAQKVLNFLLADEDLTISISNDKGETRPLLTLHGADDYSSAFIPLLEALGAYGLPSPDALKKDKDNALGIIVDALFGIIDKLVKNPYNQLVVLLPNILCFLYFGGLPSLIANALFPVNIVLDIIRPIYNFSIYGLVKDFDLRFICTDPISLLVSLLSKTVKENLGLTLNLNFTTATLYHALNTGTVEIFKSANGYCSYRVPESSINKADTVSIIFDFLLRELLLSANSDGYLNFAKEKLGLDDKVFNIIKGVVNPIRESEQKYPASGKALFFWVLFVADSVVNAMKESGLDFNNIDAKAVITLLTKLGNKDKCNFAKSEFLADLQKPGFSDILINIVKSVVQSLM